jgi:hypothetical protein
LLFPIKPIPLVVPKIAWVGVEVTLIDTITHDFKVFWTLNIVLKETFVVERSKPKPILLAMPIDTTSEQPIDDLATCVKHVVPSD